MKALLKDLAHILVELLEVAKGRFDHGEEPFAILSLEALCLGRIEVCKLCHQVLSRVPLILVRVGHQPEIDSVGVASHAHEREDLGNHTWKAVSMQTPEWRRTERRWAR